MIDRENFDRVRQVIAEEFEIPIENLEPEVTLYEKLGLDSLDSVDLVVALEREFGFKVVRVQDEERIRAIRTVSDVCDFVDYKTAQVQAGS